MNRERFNNSTISLLTDDLQNLILEQYAAIYIQTCWKHSYKQSLCAKYKVLFGLLMRFEHFKTTNLDFRNIGLTLLLLKYIRFNFEEFCEMENWFNMIKSNPQFDESDRKDHSYYDCFEKCVGRGGGPLAGTQWFLRRQKKWRWRSWMEDRDYSSQYAECIHTSDYLFRMYIDP